MIMFHSYSDKMKKMKVMEPQIGKIAHPKHKV